MYTSYEVLWLFFVCSFLGWLLETVAAAVKQKRFVNRGLINGPFCVLYGTGIVIVTVFCQELQGIWLFLAGLIISTVIEWSAGHLIEHFYHEKWWDYSKVRWNLDGYVCLPISLLWGTLSFVMMKWGNTLLLRVFLILPAFWGKLILWLLLAFLAVDMLATLILLSGRSRRIQRWQAVDSWMDDISSSLGKKIYARVDRRIQKAYPTAVPTQSEVHTEVFAYGCSLYKLLWLFVIGAFLGDLVETIFCRVTAGVWMSRSSLVWGPFSIVWGLAMAAATALLYRYRDRSDSFLFVAGTLLGGAYEYICSAFTELVFGKVFWDYSSLPFNLGGRINLLYCFFWGIAAVVWLKLCYPVMSSWIEKIPVKIGKYLTGILVVFMCCNIMVSCMALVRSDQRQKGIAATSGWQHTMDERFDDARMHRIYPNAVVIK